MSDVPDLMAAGFVLPDMDGIRLHSEIRRVDTELAQHTLFISGADQSDESREYYDHAGGFVAKPFDVAELIAELEKVLDS